MNDDGHKLSKDITQNGQSKITAAKLAQDYIEEYYKESFYIEDICSITNLGIRSLQRYFKLYFGVSISHYLKTVRLDTAYRHLSKGNSIENSVSEIAINSGFTHLGRFSTEFHQHYGIAPKHLLRQRKKC